MYVSISRAFFQGRPGIMLESLNIRYNWQLKICKQDLDFADDKDISELVHLIRNKFTHTRIRRHEQMPLLEHQVHQVQNFEQLLGVTHQSIEELKKFCKERHLIPWPTSITLGGFWGGFWMVPYLSVGLGPFYKPKEIFKIWNGIIPYLPGLIALMVNSPANGMRSKEYKSYRIIGSWWPSPAMPIDENRYSWEDQELTIESPYLISKIADCASSPQLVCEYAALFCALAYALAMNQNGGKGTACRAPAKFNRRLYEEYLINRKLAAIHGLQAVFQYDGKKREAVDLLWEVMEIAKPGLEKLGADIGDLKMINQMLQKRQTQADMALALLNRYNDLYSFYTAYANIISNFNAFEEYLASAPELKPCESPSIEDLIASRIHLKSGYWFVQMSSGLPPMQFDRFIEKLKRERKIKTEKDVDRGLLFVKSNQPSAKNQKPKIAISS